MEQDDAGRVAGATPTTEEGCELPRSTCCDAVTYFAGGFRLLRCDYCGLITFVSTSAE